MPGTDYYRAIATAKFIQDELMQERDAHNAMKLCFDKIHKSLELYKGHFINRLRFHLNRHHTEYLRKVRSTRKEKEDKKRHIREKEDTERGSAPDSPSSARRRSMRVGIAQDLAGEVEQLRAVIRRKDLEIERLAMLLDESAADPSSAHQPAVIERAVEETTSKVAANNINGSKEKSRAASVRRLMNPYLPSSSSSSDNEDVDESAATRP